MITEIAYSPGDTISVINYYFNAGQLIKVKNAYYGEEEYFFYENQQLIAGIFNEQGPVRNPTYYAERAKDFLKTLKKKPVRFTL